MKIVLVFDVAYGADPKADFGDAFWLVESPSNRALAVEAWQSGTTDSNSAVFDPPEATPTARDVLERVRDIELHHPDWTDITIVGVEPTETVRSALANAGHKTIIEATASPSTAKSTTTRRDLNDASRPANALPRPDGRLLASLPKRGPP